MRKWFIFLLTLVVTFVFASLIDDWKEISNMLSLDDFIDYVEAEVTSFTVPPYIELDLGFVVANHILAGIDTTIDYSVLTTDATLVAQYKPFRREVIKLMRNGVVITDDPEYGVYVWLRHDDKYILLNALLVKYGFAVAEKGSFYEKEFAKLMEEAKAKKLGLWTTGRFPTKVVKSTKSKTFSGVEVINEAETIFEVVDVLLKPKRQGNYDLWITLKNLASEYRWPYIIVYNLQGTVIGTASGSSPQTPGTMRTYYMYFHERPVRVEIKPGQKR